MKFELMIKRGRTVVERWEVEVTAEELAARPAGTAGAVAALRKLFLLDPQGAARFAAAGRTPGLRTVMGPA